MIPRLASMTLVTSVKQPWKQTNPKISGKLFLFFVFFFYSTWKVCDLRSSGSWQRTHRCVHLCGSLVVVFQSLRWTLGGISATAGGEAFLFKVRRLTPVCEVFHPAAMQLNREQSQESTGFPPPTHTHNCKSPGWANGNTKCSDKRGELDYPFKTSLCKQGLHGLFAYGDTDNSNTIREAEKLPLTDRWMVSTTELVLSELL